jgi:hypothetical protein
LQLREDIARIVDSHDGTGTVVVGELEEFVGVGLGLREREQSQDKGDEQKDGALGFVAHYAPRGLMLAAEDESSVVSL